MACKTSFELYHNFPKLAEESGFTFNTHKPRVHIEWNKIRLVDIESLIRERKFVIIEQHINDILDCVLESEFDVRILDEGVLKIFRLAQLAVEYQQFCRHYLDRSVYVLREEVTVLAQELESTKRALKEKEEEIRRLRKRSKSAFRTSLPYGNGNIATMILKTLNYRSDIFPTLTSPDTMQHNKCTYCDKVFLNQLYLQSHMSRRHSNMSEIPQKDVDNNQFERSNDEDVKLHNELSEMRSKLADMEQLVNNLKNTNSIEKSPNKNNNEPTNSKDVKDAEASKLAELQQLVTNLKNTMSTENKPSSSKEMKDAEVSTNSEGYILDKIEEWKKEERDKYNKEINLLRTQIIAMLDSFKEKENDTTAKTDLKIMNELHATIKQQGVEILALKQELTNSKSNPNTEEFAQRKEMEEQMSYWVKRAESQSNEYKLLLQKLDVVAKEAEKSRALAESEKMRVLQLENLLQEKIHLPKNGNKNSNDKVKPTTSEIISIDPVEIKSNPKTNLMRDRISMKKLQQKAQELLDIQNTSTSDNSVSSDEKIKKSEKNEKTLKDEKKHDINYRPSPKKQENRNKRKIKNSLRVIETSDHKGGTLAKDKSKSRLKENLHFKKENGRIIPGSPMKVIRAKITEEVNNRLVELGVDPLKTRLPENIFSKQKLQVQEQQQIKFKKNPRSEQVFHTLLTHLDSNAITLKADDTGGYDNTPTKNNKPFSLSSVISNVKTKALSLVKSNDHNKNEYKSYDNVAKKAMMLLRTPTSSTNSSPKIKAQDRDSPVKAKQLQNYTEKNDKNTNSKVRTLSHQETLKNYETDTDSSVSEINERDNYIKDQNQASATIENLVKSPTLRPPDIKVPKTTNYTINTENKNIILQPTPKTVIGVKSNANLEPSATNGNSSDDVDSLVEPMPRRAYSVENITKLTKGVLKNASSTSSLNKKKVIFDMDAIQMKSVSASSPSQSVTEKDDNMERYGLGLVNIDNDEWDISSIENEPVQKNPVISRTSPKIAELRETIESQLVRRSTLSTALVGGVDVLSAPSLKVAVGKGGSNTSLGSSILDDTDSTPAQNQVAFVKPRTFIEKDDSEIDISEFVTDELLIKNTNVIKT